MKIKVPSKTVEACDICGRQNSLLDECEVCKREYCFTCEAIICGCVHQPDVCRECAESDKVRAVILRFVKPLVDVLKKRTAALRRVRITKKDNSVL